MKKRIAILVAALAATIAMPAYAATNYYVSAGGSDTNDGTTPEKPFATFAAARTIINKAASGDFVINIIGEYNLSETVNFSQTTGGTIGSRTKKITIAGYGNTPAVIKGAATIPASEFKTPAELAPDSDNIIGLFPAASADKIKCVDLDNYGVAGLTMPLLAESVTVGEAYADGKPMNIAQYPNKGEGYLKIQNITATETKTPSFGYTDSRVSDFTDIDNIYGYGGWAYYWNSYSMKLTGIDKVNNKLSFSYRVDSELKADQEYILYNVVEDLDSPGEYYVDNSTNIMYFYPTQDMQKLEVSKLNTPLFTLGETKNIHFNNISFDVSGAEAIKIDGCSDISITNCNFENLGTKAVTASNSAATKNTNINIVNCTITNCGLGGVELQGGDRLTLTQGNVGIDGCEIYATSRRLPYGGSCALISGCGVYVKNSKLYDMPHVGISASGTEHTITGNEIYDVSHSTYDFGALYMHGDWTYCGTVIEGNYFHHIAGKNTGTRCVYFDNMTSGNIVRNNIFAYSDEPILVNGGKNFTIENNIIFDCDKPITVQKVSDGEIDVGAIKANGQSFITKCEDMKVTEGVWLEEYPWLAAAYNAYNNGDKVTPRLPTNNVVQNNVFYNSPRVSVDEISRQYGTVLNNTNEEVVLYK